MSNDYYNETDWTLQDFETPAEKAAKLAKPVAVPGTCPKCHRHIGKGIAIHTRSCLGHSEQAA